MSKPPLIRAVGQFDDLGAQFGDKRLQWQGWRRADRGHREWRTPASQVSPLGEPKLDEAMEQPIADEITAATCLNDPGDLAANR